MDPFTQRMLERAKARRAKLDNQLSNAGHDPKKRRSPLKDANAILAQAPVLATTPTKSPIKEVRKEEVRKESPKLIKSASPRCEDKAAGKENGESSGISVKPKLQRLGKLYSEDEKCAELSSPIHRTEEKFATDDDHSEIKPTKSGVRLNRLAALASAINNWEDELPEPVTKPTPAPVPATKQLKWDSKVIQSLEAQGFSRTESKSRLVYEYKEANVESHENLQKSPVKPSATASQRLIMKERTPEPTKTAEMKTPDKNPKPSSPGSVLSKASMFESKGSQTKTKDPAEMTLSERKALFEKNNTGVPLIPKAPLTMSVPTKMLLNDKPSPSGSKSDTGKAVGVQRAKFEQGSKMQELENNILQSVQSERQRELDMLRSRFNRNKESAQAAAGSCIRSISESSEGKPNSPKNSPVCPVKPTPAPDHVPVPPPLPSQNASQARNIGKATPSKRQVVGSPSKAHTQATADIKRIKVSPRKVGKIYPDLTSIEIESSETDTDFVISSEPETATCGETTENETETITEGEYRVQDSDDSDIANTSLGRSILHVVNQQSVLNKRRAIDPDPDSSMSDISVLEEMDEYLDECLANQDDEDSDGIRMEGPTPPKINKGITSPSHASHSFKYKHGDYYRSPVVKSTPSPRKETYVVEGDKSVPLMHSVSFYRKQQSQQTPKSSAKVVISRPPMLDSDSVSQVEDKDETALVQEKVKKLLDEVCKQESIIGQASQALNLCSSTIEFSGSREQVEGERLLLLATHRRQAALQEVQRLRVEGSLRPVVPGSSEVQESGSLTISAITLPLKKDFFLNYKADSCLHFVCLVRHLDNVIATPVVQAHIGDSCLRLPSTLKLQNLYSDFKVTVEVYSIETSAEVLPHEIKYHIHHSGSSGIHGSGKKSSNKTPKKLLKESRLVMPNVQSPAGPSAVRSPAFSLAGYVVFSLKEVQRQNFTLNKVPDSSALEGKLQMHVECELSVSVEYRGFLTMFEDISGYGMWHRRWCLLKGASLSYWKYPDDERKKAPIGSLDLQEISTTNVSFVSRDICARPYTLLLETVRPAMSTDKTSLVMIRKGSQTIIRHLLSADTKEDGLKWCAKINKTLHLLRTWGGSST